MKKTDIKNDGNISENLQYDDKPFVKKIEHTPLSPWHMYDILIDARGYGWDTMRDWADYVIGADLENVSEVTTGSIGLEPTDITESFSQNCEKCTQTPELDIEHGMLSVAGISKALNAPMKIVWTNQTRVLRFFTLIDNEALVSQYAEILIRRTFGQNIITGLPKSEEKTKPAKKNQTVHSEIKKNTVISFALLTAIIVSSVTYFTTLFLLSSLQTEKPIIILPIAVMVCLVSVCIFSTKYRHHLQGYFSIKQNHNEHYLDDIDLSDSSETVICGENVLYCKKPLAIIPYDDITHFHPHKTNPQYVVICTKNNTRHQLKIADFSDYTKFANNLKKNNPDITESTDTAVLQNNRSGIFAKEQRTKLILACFSLFFGIAIFAIALFNKTLSLENSIIVLALITAGILLLLYAKFGNRLKKRFDKFATKLQQSHLVNIIARIVFVVCMVSLAGFLISIFAEIKICISIFLAALLISVVPFLLTIYFSLGIFEKKPPVKIVNNKIHISSTGFFEWKKANSESNKYTYTYSIPLKEKTPKIWLYDDGKKVIGYTLQTDGNENFKGKYFIATVCLGPNGEKSPPAVQISGFISDTPEKRDISLNDIGYRMQIYFIRRSGETSKKLNKALRGQDLELKALKYPGYTTPSNVRLVGICPVCEKSFAFHGYAFYMAQTDVAYSDDGLDCCQIKSDKFKKKSWVYETDGKTFRYYNSFNCPHCGTPYIDYKKYPDNKTFGVSGCVHLGRKVYSEETQ